MGGKYIMDVKKRKEFILYIAKSFFSAYKDRVCQEEVLGVPPVLQPHTWEKAQSCDALKGPTLKT